MQQTKRALGRGLGALLPVAGGATSSDGRNVSRLFVDEIRRDSGQPRKSFREAGLKELAESIKSQGLLQPVLVRRDGRGYRLIAGERRWRAAQLAGVREIPAIVREATEAQAFELALVENLQREDLNPIEEAEGYKRLMADAKLTQEELAKRVGKDRSTVANALRLLGLPDDVKVMVASGEIDMGHARALLGLTRGAEMSVLARRIHAEKLSVRDTERQVRSQAGGAKKKGAEKRPSPQVKSLIEDLQRRLGTKVRLADRGGKGTLEVDFFSYEDLDRIIAIIRK